jgi:hypothetical protein
MRHVFDIAVIFRILHRLASMRIMMRLTMYITLNAQISEQWLFPAKPAARERRIIQYR